MISIMSHSTVMLSLILCVAFNISAAADDIGHMPSVDSAAPDQPVNSHSLTRELHYPLKTP